MTRLPARTALRIFLAGLAAAALIAPARAQAEARVIVVGDSWAIFPGVVYDTWNPTFAGNGHPEIEVFSPAQSALPGILARDYADAPAFIPGLLADHPAVEWLVISLGGNDLMTDYREGNASGWVERLEDAYRSILNPVIEARPDIKIVFPGYDFMNFEKNAFCVWQAADIFGGLLTPQINAEFLRISEAQLRMADEFGNVNAVGVWGTLQAAGGVPNPPNLLYPSPAELMNSPEPDIDCIHPGDEGYALIEQAVYDAYFVPQFACVADADADGFTDSACGGVDCDDADPAVNPAAAEVRGNGVDDDCNATTPDAPAPVCGLLATRTPARGTHAGLALLLAALLLPPAALIRVLKRRV